MTRLLKCSAPVVAAVAVIAMAQPPASASSLGTYNGTGIRIRSTPHTSGGTIYGLGQAGQHACTYFATTGDTVGGDPYWDYNKDLTTGIGPGYSADYYMYPFYYNQSC